MVKVSKKTKVISPSSDSILEMYIREAQNYPLYTREQEYSQAKKLVDLYDQLTMGICQYEIDTQSKQFQSGLVAQYIGLQLMRKKFNRKDNEFSNLEKRIISLRKDIKYKKPKPNQNENLTLLYCQVSNLIHDSPHWKRNLIRISEKLLATKYNYRSQIEEQIYPAFEIYRNNILVPSKQIINIRNDYAQANLRLVMKIAKKYQDDHLKLTDLIQEGNIGLMSALDKYDYRLGYKFSTFASWWIRQAITRSLANQKRTIRIPIHIDTNLGKLKRAQRELTNKLGRNPTFGEIGNYAGLSEEKVEYFCAYADFRDKSIDDTVNGEDDRKFGDVVPSELPSPEQQATEDDLKDYIASKLDQLLPKEADILRRRYGFGRPSQTLEEVGQDYRVTRERIRQIQEKAERKIRKKFLLDKTFPLSRRQLTF